MINRLDFIREVKRAADGSWSTLLPSCGVTVPGRGKHGACPICGGTDRFHFIDDHGGGEWHCRQCDEPSHGDGLDLIARAHGITVMAAAELVANPAGVSFPVAETLQNATSQNKATVEAERQRLELERQQAEATELEQKRQRFKRRYTALCNSAAMGGSAYLATKGLTGFTFPILPDGRLLVELTDESGAVTAAQTITPTGEKRQVTDGAKRGAFHTLAGGPEHPQAVIIAEGLATTITAQLMRPDALTVVAIDAGNLPHVAEVVRRKYPDAQIIIAGDNDWHAPGELDEHGKPKKNSGKIGAEKAASAVSGWVSLPPTEHKADWDDYRQQNGTEAAARAFNDSLYQPKAAGEEKHAGSQRDPLRPHVVSRKDGVFWITPKVDRDSGEVINYESWLCSPLEVIGTGRDDKDQYLIIRWHPAGEKIPTTAAIPLADIGEREGWRTLKAGGVNVTTKTALRATLADWLQRGGSRDIWRVAQATGWQCGAYIMPDGEIIGTPARPVLFNGRSAAAAGYTVKGTPESWRDSVARLARGNPSMMAGIGAALAAPLIGLAGADGFGIHFYEQSSAGKTTTANIASSLYGEPDALRLTWFGTALGIANEAAAHNDGLMPLDEVGQGADPDSVAKSAYTLFNGVGKLQGAKEGGNRDLKRWRTVALSTGEMDIETFIASTGRKVKAGQLVRLLNIPLEKSQQHHETANGKAHADALKDAYQSHHGAAGRFWIKYLADHQQQAIDAVREAESRWRSLIPADYGEQVHRVAARFAVLEAALLFGRSVTGWDAQECRDAIQHNFNAWIKEFGTGNKEHQQAIEATEAFLNAYGLSRFAPLPYDPQSLPIRDLAGYRDRGKHDCDAMVFYTFPAAFENEIARGFNTKHFAKALAEAGMLTQPASKRGFQRKSPRIEGRQINVYVIHHLPENDQGED
ncbi:DNA primase TraC [Serratia fonticola]|nr:DNA primase TraC [Serratia fonticola]CAI0958092.1 DNA primase TraC [Serratia fonticola]